MENLSDKIPVEVLGYIFSLREGTESKDLASVSKTWNAGTKESMKFLFQSYERSAVLKPYTELAKQLHIVTPKGQKQDQYEDLQRVKFVFHEVMAKAQQMGYKKESPKIENLSAVHMQDVVKWIQEQEAQNLNLFVSQIPEMNTFLDTIRDLSDLEKAKEIKTWMKDNKDTLNGITTLNCEEMNLTALPEEIKYFTGLQKLILSKNQLTTVPTEIGSLTNLVWLSLSHNKLTTLPSEIRSLTNLQSLFLFENQQETFPSEIGSLTNLIRLDLSDNQLTIVPSEIRSLTNLTELNVSDNKITDFPDNIAHLTHRGKGVFKAS